jgi:hypothetical protein
VRTSSKKLTKLIHVTSFPHAVNGVTGAPFTQRRVAPEYHVAKPPAGGHDTLCGFCGAFFLAAVFWASWPLLDRVSGSGTE